MDALLSALTGYFSGKEQRRQRLFEEETTAAQTDIQQRQMTVQEAQERDRAAAEVYNDILRQQQAAVQAGPAALLAGGGPTTTAPVAAPPVAPPAAGASFGTPLPPARDVKTSPAPVVVAPPPAAMPADWPALLAMPAPTGPSPDAHQLRQHHMSVVKRFTAPGGPFHETSDPKSAYITSAGVPLHAPSSTAAAPRYYAEDKVLLEPAHANLRAKLGAALEQSGLWLRGKSNPGAVPPPAVLAGGGPSAVAATAAPPEERYPSFESWFQKRWGDTPYYQVQGYYKLTGTTPGEEYASDMKRMDENRGGPVYFLDYTTGKMAPLAMAPGMTRAEGEALAEAASKRSQLREAARLQKEANAPALTEEQRQFNATLGLDRDKLRITDENADADRAMDFRLKEIGVKDQQARASLATELNAVRGTIDGIRKSYENRAGTYGNMPLFVINEDPKMGTPGKTIINPKLDPADQEDLRLALTTRRRILTQMAGLGVQMDAAEVENLTGLPADVILSPGTGTGTGAGATGGKPQPQGEWTSKFKPVGGTTSPAAAQTAAAKAAAKKKADDLARLNAKWAETPPKDRWKNPFSKGSNRTLYNMWDERWKKGNQ